MRCPTLRELPPPPPGKTGWPWTEETQPIPDTMPDGGEWPKISIVTPNYNYGQFIEETIRSVLLQGYPNLEYIVIDGGSTDDSVEIIKKYEPWLSYWVSEKDKGQSNAINKGLKMCTGQIAAYINSDDYYLIGAFNYIGKIFNFKKFDILVGRNKTNISKPKYWLLRRSYWLTRVKTFRFPFIFQYNRYELSQESIVWNHSRYQKLCFDERYQFCLDVWWFVQIYSDSRVVHTSKRIGYFRSHPESKSSTMQDICKCEIENICQRTKKWKNPISKKQVLKIIFQYYLSSTCALLCKLLLPHLDLTFQYYHPPYIK